MTKLRKMWKSDGTEYTKITGKNAKWLGVQDERRELSKRDNNMAKTGYSERRARQQIDLRNAGQ